jgi:hypothetical protein
MDCLAHFVKECLANNSDPLEVMYSSSNGSDNSSPEERKAMWKNMLQWHQTKSTLTPYHWKCITFTKFPQVASKEKPNKHNTRRKRKAVIMMEKTTAKRGNNVKAPSKSKQAGTKVPSQSGTTNVKAPQKTKCRHHEGPSEWCHKLEATTKVEDNEDSYYEYP